MRLKFRARISARAHGQNFGLDPVAALNVPWRVADDDNFRSRQVSSEKLIASLLSKDGQFVAIFVIISEGAHLKAVPQTEVAQFDFRAQTDVAREQTHQRRLRQAAQALHELPDSGASSALELGQQMVQPEYVGVKETPEIARRRFDPVGLETLANQGGIGAPGKTDPVSRLRNLELRGERPFKRLHPSAAGADQGAVDIE